MLADPRSESLATRFATQWLRLQDLERVQPDAFWFPHFNEQLKAAMRRETELFFDHLVREDRSLLELYSAGYSFMNQRLAEHYGVQGVVGEDFRRVDYPEGMLRQGLLGHGSVLVSTSMGTRTSPVLRGKWVMEVLLDAPPPPPPPDVPALEETEDEGEGRLLTTRERLEIHRRNPVCAACHQFMDPIGVALENFGVTGGMAESRERIPSRRPGPALRRHRAHQLGSARGRAPGATDPAGAHLHHEPAGVRPRAPRPSTTTGRPYAPSRERRRATTTESHPSSSAS